MPVRALRPLDVIELASPRKDAVRTELSAHTWPLAEPESNCFGIATLGAASLFPRLGRQRAWVAEEHGRLVGLAMARPRAGGLAWDVEHLHATRGDESAVTSLLEKVAENAASHGARRVFLMSPEEDAARDSVRRAGLEHYASASTFHLARGFRVPRTDSFEGRPRLRADEPGLFQLYMAAVPAPVRAAEAMTLEEWRGLYRGSRPWRPSFSGSRQQIVWELGTTLVGWMEITYGERSQFLEILIHPRYEDAADRLLRSALLQASPKAPVYLLARDFQAGLAPALQAAGLSCVSRVALHVRMLAARVSEPLLAPASLAGG